MMIVGTFCNSVIIVLFLSPSEEDRFCSSGCRVTDLASVQFIQALSNSRIKTPFS